MAVYEDHVTIIREDDQVTLQVAQPGLQTVVDETVDRVAVVNLDDVRSIGEQAGDIVVINGTGVPGPPGTAGGNYHHIQAIPSSSWLITHDLGFYPAGVFVVDTAGSQVEGDPTYIDTNNLRIDFVGSFAGDAYVS